MSTLTKRCAQDGDNAVDRAVSTSETNNPVLDLGSGLLVGESGAGVNYWWNTAFRFSGINIPNGATILSAKVTFTSRSTNASDVAYSPTIYMDAADNSATYGANWLALRSTSTATAAWTTPASRTLDATFDTPDLTTLVQEIVNRAGWAQGNAMSIIIKTTSGTANNSGCDVYYYADSTTKAALLTVSFKDRGGSFFYNII